MAITDFEFHQLVDEIFQTIDNALEVLIDEQDADIDVDGSGNVLQLEFNGTSTIVMNKQEPLHEIWLATQFGGYHFAYVDGNGWTSAMAMNLCHSLLSLSLNKAD